MAFAAHTIASFEIAAKIRRWIYRVLAGADAAAGFDKASFRQQQNEAANNMTDLSAGTVRAICDPVDHDLDDRAFASKRIRTLASQLMSGQF
jgi:hypothetical protein